MFVLADNPVVQRLRRQEMARREEERLRARRQEAATNQDDAEAQQRAQRVREATRSCAYWLRNYTATYNPHWVEEGRPKPNEPFPDWYFFEPVIEIVDREPVSAFAKSRDMMASWVIVGYFTFQAMLVPQREIVFQTLEVTKVEQLVSYAKALYDNQPTWLREAFPLPKPADKQAADTLEFSNGSHIIGVPGGLNKMRSYHPWGYFNDESSFQPEFRKCLDEALGSGVQKIVCNSTADESSYEDYLNDVKL